MAEEKHYFIPAKNKKECEKCKKIYSECMKWIDLFVIEGPKERDFFWKNEKANYVTDLFTFELVQTIPDLEEKLNIITIESTKSISYLLNKKGHVIAWGLNDNPEEQLIFTSPAVIRELMGIQVVALACGEEHVLALEVGMYVWSWGSNDFFQLSREEKGYYENEKIANYATPKRIEEINNIVRIAAGPFSSFAVHMNGSVYAWGKNNNFSLGIEQTQHVKKATELISCPWVREMKRNKKTYFKPEKIREVEIAGASLSKIRAMKIENSDLHNRISPLSKKVDFLEDEVQSINNRKLQKLWDADMELKELIKLKEICFNKNTVIDKKITEIDKQIKELEKQKEVIQVSIDAKDSEISELWSAIVSIEREMKKLKKDSALIRTENNEKQAKDCENEFTSKAESRKDQQAEFLNKEMEKASYVNQVNELNEKIFKLSKEKDDLKMTKDPHIENYNRMASIKKKQIAEQNILKFSSRTYQEVQDIKKVHDTIEKASVEYLTKRIGRLSHPEEIFSISNQIYDIIDKHVKEKLKVSGFRYVGSTMKVWNVIHENVKVAMEVNQLKQTLCHRFLKSSKVDLKPCGEKGELDKHKIVKEILKGIGITEFNIVFDNFSQKIGDKAKKASMKKLIDEGTQKKSGWRACF